MPESINPQQLVNWFRHSAPYINAHRGHTFVVLFSGKAVADPRFSSFIHDIALLNSLGIKLCLVHGAREQIETQLKAQHIESTIIDGLRVTDEATLQIVKQTVGSVRMDIEAMLSMGIANSPMAGARIKVSSGNFITARPVGVKKGIDFAHTGEVRRIDTESIRQNLDNNTIVLLSSIAYSPTGEIFSMSAEEVATSTAVQLNADKIIYLSDSDEHSKSFFSHHQLNANEACTLSKTQPESCIHLEYATHAIKNGVSRAHIIDREQDGSLLLELFTRDGVGVMVTADNYDVLRQATIDDIGGILELIEPLEIEGILVRRSREKLETEINHYMVLERDGTIIGCTALYAYPKEHVAELACLVIHPDYQKEGRGDHLLLTIEKQLRNSTINALFVLTSRTAHWFQERGFQASDIGSLPIEKQALYNLQRKSKVFIKTLGSIDV